jgi:hypothetical protein
MLQYRSMKQTSVAAALLVITTLLGQQAPPDDKKLSRVSGRVVNARTNEPLRKVNVTLTPVGVRNVAAPQIVTQADGLFSFEQVTPGRPGVVRRRV